MSVDRKLLEILVCPVTKQPVSMLPPGKLEALNRKIAAGEVQNHGGNTLEEPLGEALITANGSAIYPVSDGIPVMLEDESIDTGLLQDF
jgi:uncharacterized protein YbaR (Trm112 family)